MSYHALSALRRSLSTLRPSGSADRPASGEAPDRDHPIRADGGAADRGEADHLRDLPDGAGCTEIWEHLSGRADADD